MQGQQDTFTYEYGYEATGGGASREPGSSSSPSSVSATYSDYLNNVWSDNWNHFDGEVPLAGPTAADFLEARPELRGLMAELTAAEDQFWMGRYAMGNNNGRADKNNIYQKLHAESGGGSAAGVDFFKSCPQGQKAKTATGGGLITGIPGTFHSCPTLHVHGDNYTATPPSLLLQPWNSAAGGGEGYFGGGVGAEEENKVDSRMNTLKGLPVAPSVSARKQKPCPQCSICSSFGLNTPPACPDCPETIYNAYKRNCTYRNVFEKQEVLDPQVQKEDDPAEPIRTLFDENPTPSLDEIGRALLPETGGLTSPTTPSTWVQDLIEFLSPSHPIYTTTKTSALLGASSAAAAASVTGSTSGKSKSKASSASASNAGRRKFSFPKLKSRPSRLKKEEPPPSMAIVPLPKLARLNKKLLHVKSRYLNHFMPKATMATTATSATAMEKKDTHAPGALTAAGASESGDGVDILGVGVGVGVVLNRTRSKSGISGAKGDTLALETASTIAASSLKKATSLPLPLTTLNEVTDSFIRLTTLSVKRARPRTRGGGGSGNLKLKSKKSKSKFGKPSKDRLARPKPPTRQLAEGAALLPLEVLEEATISGGVGSSKKVKVKKMKSKRKKSSTISTTATSTMNAKQDQRIRQRKSQGMGSDSGAPAPAAPSAAAPAPTKQAARTKSRTSRKSSSPSWNGLAFKRSRASAISAKKRIQKVQDDLERYKQQVLKALEAGKLKTGGQNVDLSPVMAATASEQAQEPEMTIAPPPPRARKPKPAPKPPAVMLPISTSRTSKNSSSILKKPSVQVPIHTIQLELELNPPPLPDPSGSLHSVLSSARLISHHSDPGSPSYLGLGLRGMRRY